MSSDAGQSSAARLEPDHHGHRPDDRDDKVGHVVGLVDEGRRIGSLLDEWAGLQYTHPHPERDETLHVPIFVT